MPKRTRLPALVSTALHITPDDVYVTHAFSWDMPVEDAEHITLCDAGDQVGAAVQEQSEQFVHSGEIPAGTIVAMYRNLPLLTRWGLTLKGWLAR